MTNPDMTDAPPRRPRKSPRFIFLPTAGVNLLIAAIQVRAAMQSSGMDATVRWCAAGLLAVAAIALLWAYTTSRKNDPNAR